MTNENQYKTWQEKHVRPNQHIVYEASCGLLVGRCSRQEIVKFEGSLGNLAANTSTPPTAPPALSRFNFQILYDNSTTPPREALYFTRNKHLWQMFLALSAKNARLFLSLPQGQVRCGFKNALGITPADFAREWGYLFKGRESSIEKPTDAGEVWLPQNTSMEIGVQNMDDFAITLQFGGIINQIDIGPYDPRDPNGRNIIQAILKHQVRPENVVWAKAGLDLVPMTTTDFIKSFGVPPVLWDGVVMGVASE